MLKILTVFGFEFSFIVTVTLVLFLFFGVRVFWTCGMCGKANVTGLFKALMCICDHEGLS